MDTTAIGGMLCLVAASVLGIAEAKCLRLLLASGILLFGNLNQGAGAKAGQSTNEQTYPATML